MSSSPQRCEPPEEWGDKSLPEDSAIQAAHPLNGGDPDRMAEAMRLVGAKRSKAALVELVNWLLAREAAAYQRGQREMRQGAAQEAQMFSDGLHRIHPDVAWDHMSEEAKSIGHAVAQNIAAGIAALPIKEKPE